MAEKLGPVVSDSVPVGSGRNEADLLDILRLVLSLIVGPPRNAKCVVSGTVARQATEQACENQGIDCRTSSAHFPSRCGMFGRVCFGI